MSALLGVVRYEYRMAVRRWGMWVAFIVAALFYIVPAVTGELQEPTLSAWAFAGSLALNLNVLMPVIGGITMADRLPRDSRLGVRELLAATPLCRRTYVLGKYVGAVAAAVTPVLAVIALLAAIIAVRGLAAGIAPLELAGLAGSLLAAFLVINLPAYLFVGAFSLACPAVLPVRVYQVLYTGYWFWGNFTHPDFLPTLAGTPFEPSGRFVGSAFFQAGLTWAAPAHTAAEAVVNLLVLGACAAAALVALERYLAWQERRA